ncbi:MAG: response regulator containing a CheY-like receiver domain and an DNA-binding domain [Bacteroidetes bacterium]|jgi:DNA-binding NarL/FixJ family response regulator|nr:response regulator containing a CheY-like receiver domain and an DNA-binding domain [Bacteroidota bacterium]
MKEATRIFIADDHQMFIDGIKALMHTSGIKITGSANNGVELLQKLSETEVDIVLMDIGMPELNGIETTNQISLKHPHIKVIALTMYDDPTRIVKMLKAGAKGYVLKNTSKEELMEAIHTVAEGGVYYSDKIIVKTMQTITTESDPLSKLTEREIEIIRLIAKSFTNKEIAGQLSISEFTVNTHRKNAMRKLSIKNTAGLVKFAIEQDL